MTDEEHQKIYDLRLLWRNILPGEECPKCQGTGTFLYSNTSMWRHSVGGRAMTWGPCDSCWGSGDKYRPWMSHRECEQLQRNTQKPLRNDSEMK